jgi:hypothetical protein
LSKENEDGKLDDKNQRTKVLSTKLPVDQLESFNLLVEYLSKTGVIQTSTPSALVRSSITQLLNTYHDDIENYRITKKQRTANNNGHQPIIRKIENNQILGNKHPHPPVNNDGPTPHQGMNMAPVRETEYLREKVHDNNKLPTNENLEPSSIQSTKEELKKTKREMQFLGNNEQPRAEDPIANLYKLDLAKFMYILVMLDRQNKSKLVYLEVNDVTKEVFHIIPSYGLEIWKKEKADKN